MYQEEKKQEVAEVLVEVEKEANEGEGREKESRESVFQREMRELGEETKALGESAETVGSIWALARQEKSSAVLTKNAKKFQMSQEQKQEEELKTAQIKERMDALLSKAESAFLMAKNLAEGVVGMKLDEIKGIHIQSARDAERLNALLKDIENGYLLARENMSEVKLLEQEAAKFQGQYKETSLVEAGFHSFEEVRDAHYELEHESFSLQYDIGRRKNDFFGLGRFINKEKIKDLEQEIETLKPKIGELSDLRQLENERPKSFYDQPISEKLYSSAKEISQVSVDKMLNRQADLLREIKLEEPAALLDPVLKEKIFGGKNIDEENYHYVMNFIQNNEAIAKRKIIIDSHQNIIQISNINNMTGYSYERIGNNTQLQISKGTFDTYEMIKNNQEAVEIIGENKLREADNFLAKSTLDELMRSVQNNSYDSEEFGERLFHFKEASIIPFAIINGYRSTKFLTDMEESL